MSRPAPSLFALPLAAVLLLAPTSATEAQQDAAALRLPAVFADHMVVQRETEAPLWGWAPAGSAVRVSADWPGAETVTATADADGRFQVTLRTGAAGGPYRVTVATADESVVLEDVLLGEVWVASGQSNMEWPLRASDVGSATLAASGDTPPRLDRPTLRLFKVAHEVAVRPREDVRGVWQACTPESAMSFSAVALHFGGILADELGVPIGLVQTTWGGTPAEAWTPGDSLEAVASQAQRLESVRALADDSYSAEERHEAALQRWLVGLRSRDAGMDAGWWGDAEVDTSGWAEASLPGAWESSGPAVLKDFDGIAWYRRTVEIPEAWAGRELVLELGPVDDMDWTWFGGAQVGSHVGADHWNRPRRYVVPAESVTAGATAIAVRVLDTGGAGGFGGAADAMRLFPAGDPDAAVSLAGTWKMRRGALLGDLPRQPSTNAPNQSSPTTLWNGMVAPLVPMAMAGAIWYQGESNRSRWQEYRELFPTMIRGWRQAWGEEFPFYFVQIAPFNYGGDSGQAAALREAQAMTLALPHTGMAVTMDLGNPADIHPRNKHEVGRRLALWAMAEHYGAEDVRPRSPMPADVTRIEGGLRVSFAHHDGALQTPGGLTLFEVAGADGVWHPAEARIGDGGTVLVRCAQVPEPRAVRYAWGAADVAELFDADGLPAPSFRAAVE